MKKTQTMPSARTKPKLVKLADAMLEFFGPEAQVEICVSYPGDDNSFHLVRNNPS